MDHKNYMEMALEEAKVAYKKNEVPVGAVIVKDNQVIARAHNLREENINITAHAEILAIEKASKHLGTWNLSECTLYVTVEPCPMCAGAIIQSQIKEVVFACIEPNSGSFGTIVDLSNLYNHKPNIVSGVCSNESEALMKEFFKNKREQSIKVKKIKQEELNTYLGIRKTVFVEEQKVSIEEEIDQHDHLNNPDVIHIAAYKAGVMIGTQRIFRNKDEYTIGRVAVLKAYRNTGVGTAMLAYAQKQALNNGIKTLKLGAQLSAVPFYEKNGYIGYGSVYLDANIKHINMKKNL